MFGLDVMMKAAGLDVETTKNLAMNIAKQFAEIHALATDTNMRVRRIEAALLPQTDALAVTAHNEEGHY